MSERKSKSEGKSDKPDIRVPPQNLNAERGLLGSFLLMPDSFDEVCEQIDESQFYAESHRLIFQAVKLLRSEGAATDAVVVAEKLAKRKVLDAAGGIDYLQEILAATPHAGHVRHYAEVVREKAIQREVIYAATEMLSESYDSTKTADELLDFAQSKVMQIAEERGAVVDVELRDVLASTLEAVISRQGTNTPAGVCTGLIDIDEKTTGFRGGELIILAARPGMGKTALVCNIAETVAENSRSTNGDPLKLIVPGEKLPTGAVLMFSLEQSKIELAERFICIRSSISLHSMRKGTLNPSDLDMIMRASTELGELPILTDDNPSRSVTSIAAIARRFHRSHKLKLIIIDYLQLVQPDDSRVPREQQVAGITKKLKWLARDLDVPVITLAQLNRAVDGRADKKPILSDLRESGAIEQDADVVMFLHRPEIYDPTDRPGEAVLSIAKNRHGPGGDVRLVFKAEAMRFQNHAGDAFAGDENVRSTYFDQ